MKRIVVFPNDPLYLYFKKGEVKERYFNPLDLFDEVHVFSLCDKEIDAQKVKSFSGKADLKIYAVGFPRFWKLPFMFSYRNKIMGLIRRIKPDVIRSFNPLINGWLAVSIGRALGIPSVISLHGDHDRDIRYQLIRQRRWKEYLIHYLYSKIVEPYCIANADRVVCKYRFPVEYAKRYGARKVEVIYNWVDLDRFCRSNQVFRQRQTVLCVGRLIKEKNQQCLIRAVKGLDVKLIIVGDGPEYTNLVRLISGLGLQNQVSILRSVPHDKIDSFYKNADIFALPILYGGIAIPVMEAMASSLPLVVPKPLHETEPELVADIAVVCDNNPDSFREGIKRLASDERLRRELGEKGRKLIQEVSMQAMEARERQMYEELIGNRN